LNLKPVARQRLARIISDNIREVERALALWMKILGVLLILLGLTLFASPQITYTRREKVIDTGSTEITAKRQKTVIIPRGIALLVVGAGVLTLLRASRKPQQ
jgi:hypothetical protein